MTESQLRRIQAKKKKKRSQLDKWDSTCCSDMEKKSGHHVLTPSTAEWLQPRLFFFLRESQITVFTATDEHCTTIWATFIFQPINHSIYKRQRGDKDFNRKFSEMAANGVIVSPAEQRLCLQQHETSEKQRIWRQGPETVWQVSIMNHFWMGALHFCQWMDSLT